MVKAAWVLAFTLSTVCMGGCDYFPAQLLLADAIRDLPADTGSQDLVVDGSLLDAAADAPAVDAPAVDAPAADTASVDAGSPLTKFGVPAPIPGVNTNGSEKSPHLSQDGLRLYFTATRTGGVGSRDIWVTSRTSTKASFGPATLVTGVSTKEKEEDPTLTADERIIVWEVDNGTNADLFQATRATKGGKFGSPQPLSTLNTSYDDVDPGIMPDGLTLVFGSYRKGGKGSGDLYVSTRSSTTKAFGAPVLIKAANSSADDYDPFLSDGGQLVFVSYRSGGKGQADLWFSQKTGSSFSPAVNLPLNSKDVEEDPFVHTGLRLFLYSKVVKGNFDMYWVSY